MNRTRPFQLTVPVNAADHALGTEIGPVTVVEYGDFECPNCKQAAPAVAMLLRRFSGKLRFAYRHFPLEEVHSHALAAAEAAECAGGQDRFWPMHNLLFEYQLQLEDSDLSGYATRLQLDLARYASETANHVHLGKIREDMQSGRDSGARATPTFFVDDRIQDVSFGMHSLFDAVEAALSSRGLA